RRSTAGRTPAETAVGLTRGAPAATRALAMGHDARSGGKSRSPYENGSEGAAFRAMYLPQRPGGDATAPPRKQADQYE
ncbi:MAG: hypothetical protein WB816_02120, partial [Methylocystis sp.]